MRWMVTMLKVCKQIYKFETQYLRGIQDYSTPFSYEWKTAAVNWSKIPSATQCMGLGRESISGIPPFKEQQTGHLDWQRRSVNHRSYYNKLHATCVRGGPSAALVAEPFAPGTSSSEKSSARWEARPLLPHMGGTFSSRLAVGGMRGTENAGELYKAAAPACV